MINNSHNLALLLRSDRIGNYASADVILLDLSTYDFSVPYTSQPSPLVAGVCAWESGENWRVAFSAARPGFGIVIYELTAASLGKSLYPSSQLSGAARRFWAKHGTVCGNKLCLKPLPLGEIESKYGINYGDLIERGSQVPEEIYTDVVAEISDIASGAYVYELQHGVRIPMRRNNSVRCKDESSRKSS